MVTLLKEMTKTEIEKSIQGLGEFVQIDRLLRFLKEQEVPTETKKFVYVKLASIYEKKAMFFDASKMYDNAAIYCLNDHEKSSYYIKECEALIQGGFFDHVEKAMQKAFTNMNQAEKEYIYDKIKEFYKKLAENYEAQLKRSNAVRVYEKMLELKMSEQEKNQIKAKLMELYEKLGKVRKQEVGFSSIDARRRSRFA